MSPETVIASCALLFAVVSFLISLHSASVAGRRARMPALIFTYDLKYRQWVLRNVGNGPALDIVVAQRAKDTEKWYMPVRVPPMGQDDQFVVWWLESTRDFGLGARYHDMVVGDSSALRHVYVTRTGNDVSRIYAGRRSRRVGMPTWPDGNVTRHWQLPEPSPEKISSIPETERGRVVHTLSPGSQH
jgi:hypothetical protein